MPDGRTLETDIGTRLALIPHKLVVIHTDADRHGDDVSNGSTTEAVEEKTLEARGEARLKASRPCSESYMQMPLRPLLPPLLTNAACYNINTLIRRKYIPDFSSISTTMPRLFLHRHRALSFSQSSQASGKK